MPRTYQSAKDPLFWVGERFVSRAAAVTMVNGQVIFTTAGGNIQITHLWSECVTANDATASTIQYSHDPTIGAAVTISGASATLASAAIGTTVMLNMTALATAPDIVVTGTGLGPVAARSIILSPGALSIVIGVGSTTGTWRHHMRYIPLQDGAEVIIA